MTHSASSQPRDSHGRWGRDGGGLRDKVKKLKDKIKGKEDLGDIWIDEPPEWSNGGYPESRKASELEPGDKIKDLGTVKENLGTDMLGEQMILTDKGEHSLSPNERVLVQPAKRRDPLDAVKGKDWEKAEQEAADFIKSDNGKKHRELQRKVNGPPPRGLDGTSGMANEDLSQLSDEDLRAERKAAQQEMQRVSRIYDSAHPEFTRARRRQLNAKREVARRQAHGNA